MADFSFATPILGECPSEKYHGLRKTFFVFEYRRKMW
jgi:hypothetical protein